MLPNNDWRREVYRASRLDEFRMYLAGEMYNGDEYTSDDFIARLTVKTESPAMAAGTAVHAIIENAAFSELPDRVSSNGWLVHFDLDAELRMPAAREVKLHREHKGIPLFGRVDAIDAISVHDTKTTSAVDIDRYMDSYQWRSYLWMSGRERFVYDILRVKLDEEAKIVTVVEYLRLPLTAYPDLSLEVEGLLEQYDACIRDLGIEGRLAS